MSPTPHDSLLTAVQVQKRLGISRTTLYKWLLEKRLTAVRFGARCTRFRSSEVDALVASGTATVERTNCAEAISDE